MKFLIVCLAIAGCASAGLLPHQHQHYSSEATAPVLRSTSDIHPDGHYEAAYETGNGIVAQEAGIGGKTAQGSYSYTSPEGIPISVQYVADENGFQPIGQHLPVAPATPEHVVRLLKYLAEHPQQPEQYTGVRVAQPFVQTYKPTYAPFRFNKF